MSASGWYRRRFVRRRLAEVGEGNAAQTADIEHELLGLGASVVPALLWALEHGGLSEYQKCSAVRVLARIGDARGLEPLRSLAERGSDVVSQHARRDLRVLCLRLDRKGQLPEEYRGYLNPGDETRN